MDGVRFITPAQNQESMTVSRLLHPSSADTIAARGKLQVNCYKKSTFPGLKGINICELATVTDATARSVKNVIAADPLYAKASEIIAAAPPGELDSVILHLGGFHLLIRFMGSIGLIMSGSGIEELWMQVYAKSSVTHIISGHAFYRAVRAHMLTSQALITMILGMENLFDAVESPVLVRFPASFERKCTALSKQCSTAAFPVCLKLCNTLEELSGIKAGSYEQHIELRDSRRTRDARDVAVLLSWLKEHSPWDVDYLRSLASGVVGYNSINCNQAEYVGLGAIKCIIGSTFGEVKLMQKNRVKPLSAVARSILIRDDVVELFSYTTPEEISTNYPRRIVIDGGHLLHALVWPHLATYGQIADAYLEFVQKHYRVPVTVVLDGYNVQSTKSQEHFLHASKGHQLKLCLT
ncbi:hypothetical protein PR048_033091 [Dryococelus australis]|uniref:Uncharacterized protein n=1 Tax=Dryococelus australis TaxID=614101 RepID=A0ABQ9G235_9NEOP|nr:hypothetical protein PR048_033091 [Dryococelus australis]